MDKETRIIGAVIPERTAQALEQLAKQEDRSLSRVVARILAKETKTELTGTKKVGRPKKAAQ